MKAAVTFFPLAGSLCISAAHTSLQRSWVEELFPGLCCCTSGCVQCLPVVGTKLLQTLLCCAVLYCAAAGMASVALVLSILVPSVGNWWYLLTLVSPAAWFYYFQKGERVEQVRLGSDLQQEQLQVLSSAPYSWLCLCGCALCCGSCSCAADSAWLETTMSSPGIKSGWYWLSGGVARRRQLFGADFYT